MAGGKETPRQRLIGLMYLVLLAMLAIQVSDAVMEKFFFLEQSLGAAKDETVKRNAAQLASISKKATERGTAEALDMKKKAEEVRKISEETIKYIEVLKTDLVSKTGGVDEGKGGLYNGAKEEAEVEEMFIGPSKNGKAYELKTKLDAFYNQLTTLVPSVKAETQQLAFNGSEDPLFMKNADQKIKDFANLNFGQTPMVAAMAVLTEKANKVAAYEALALAKIDPEAVTIKVDKIEASYRALSSVVAAGTDYEAEIFLTAKNQALKPDVTFRGAKVAVDANGYAKIKFRAAGGSYDKDGLFKTSWNADVLVPKPGGGSEKQVVKGEYIVAKPVVDVQAGAVSALYERCGNELKIRVPALGANYKPSFSVSNAGQVNGKAPGDLIVIPQSKNSDVTIGVSSSGSFIDKVTFKVRPVPNPQIEIRTPTGPVSQKTGIRANTPTLTIKVIPDASFAQFLPKEAEYTVVTADYAVVRGRSTVVASGKVPQGGVLRTGNLNLQPNTRVVLENITVTRKNFRGETIDVPLPTTITTQGIPVSE